MGQECKFSVYTVPRYLMYLSMYISGCMMRALGIHAQAPTEPRTTKGLRDSGINLNLQTSLLETRKSYSKPLIRTCKL